MTRKRVPAVLAIALLQLAILLDAGYAFASETVPQPIAFSHKIHVTDY